MSEQRVCLVHYHEIGLKGKNRAHFEKQLITNIKAVLGDAPVARIKRISGGSACSKRKAQPMNSRVSSSI